MRISDSSEYLLSVIAHIPTDEFSDSENFDNESKFSTEVVYESTEAIGSFCLNSLDASKMALINNNCVFEINVEVSAQLFKQEYVKSKNVSSNNLFDPNESGSVVMTRNLSYDTINKLLNRNFVSPVQKTHKKGKNETMEVLKRKVPSVTSLESHNLAGYGDVSSPDVTVTLYQFGEFREVARYSAKSDGVLSKCHFDPFGIRFAAADTKGDLFLWKFDSAPSSERPNTVLKKCHSGAVAEFCYLNSSSILATAGLSWDQMNVCVWDTLLPQSKAKVKVGEAGIASLVYQPQSSLLIAGGEKGNIYMMDVRQGMAIVDQIKAHEGAIRSLAIGSTPNTMISGTNTGEIKIWDLGGSKITVQDTISVFSGGITSIKTKNDIIYTSCSDGSIRRIKYNHIY